MIKGSVHQEDITIVSIYSLNFEALKYIKQLLTDLKAEIGSSAIRVRDFNT